MGKKSLLAAGTAVCTAALMVFSSGAATAATATWFNGSATINKQYTEGLVSQSRTGCKAGFTELQVKGTAQIFSYFGSSWTDAWAVSTTVNGATSYNKCGLKWNMPHTSGSTKVVGTALNVGPLQRVAAGSVGATAPATVAQVAEAEGVDASALVLAGDTGAAEVWTAELADSVWVFLVGDDGTVAGASTTTEAFASDSLSLRLGDAKAGVESQVVVVPAGVADRAASATLASFDEVAEGVFVTSSATSRARAANEAYRVAASESVDGYTVHVLG